MNLSKLASNKTCFWKSLHLIGFDVMCLKSYFLLLRDVNSRWPAGSLFLQGDRSSPSHFFTGCGSGYPVIVRPLCPCHNTSVPHGRLVMNAAVINSKPTHGIINDEHSFEKLNMKLSQNFGIDGSKIMFQFHDEFPHSSIDKIQKILPSPCWTLNFSFKFQTSNLSDLFKMENSCIKVFENFVLFPITYGLFM